jgi:hypothetical protein
MHRASLVPTTPQGARGSHSNVRVWIRTRDPSKAAIGLGLGRVRQWFGAWKALTRKVSVSR